MAKKSRKNLAKIAAGLGAAYALSKMGKGTMDGTEGDFPASSRSRLMNQIYGWNRRNIPSFRKTKKRKR
jgi:hypothetical protein